MTELHVPLPLSCLTLAPGTDTAATGTSQFCGKSWLAPVPGGVVGEMESPDGCRSKPRFEAVVVIVLTVTPFPDHESNPVLSSDDIGVGVNPMGVLATVLPLPLMGLRSRNSLGGL